jgi:hypothetical protein
VDFCGLAAFVSRKILKIPEPAGIDQTEHSAVIQVGGGVVCHPRFSLVFEGSDPYDGACVGHFLGVDGDDALYLFANTLHRGNIFVKLIANKCVGVFAVTFPFFSHENSVT